VKGGFFLRKKSLECVPSVYANSENAIAVLQLVYSGATIPKWRFPQENAALHAPNTPRKLENRSNSIVLPMRAILCKTGEDFLEEMN
jgi:hypothetical protein